MAAGAPLGTETIKHLELIQAVISRLAGNSFLLKGWCLTVSGAFFGFSVTQASGQLALVGVGPILMFWSLDGYFLRHERLFRLLYDEVRQGRITDVFSMDARGASQEKPSWWRVIRSITLVPFYGTLVILAIGVSLVAARIEPATQQAPRSCCAVSSLGGPAHPSVPSQMSPMESPSHLGRT